ncbi:MAG: sigma-70 family RNA polymerase sigma factor [Myxococcales bacterium]|nr:sigma-70 family RNA polymerase sigma factor [Myxococcales bacterium]
MDPQTLERVYQAELGAVHSFLARLGAPSGDLPDLLHDVFLTAVRRWSSYDPQRPVRPWLMGIAFNVYGDWKKTGARRFEEGRDELPERGDGTDLESQVEARKTGAMVQAALLELDEPKRAAFVMHHFEGLSPNEISEVMQVPAATTYTRLRTARIELTAAVRRRQSPSPGAAA